MQIWTQLVNTALLGTDKMPLNVATLPQMVQDKLKSTNPNEQETHFLQAASLAWVLKKTSDDNLLSHLPAIGFAQPESQLYAPASAGVLLQKILENEQFIKALLDLFLDKILEKTWIISPKHLVKLISEGIKQNPETQQKIIDVIGERGKWLAGFEPSWQYINPVLDEEIWQTGNAQQRITLLNKIRQSKPSEALEMLENTWEQEAARDKKALLEVLAVNLSKDDENFINGVYQAVLKQKDNDKGIKAEIKQLSVELLLSIENSELSTWLWQEIQAYFTQKKKLLSLSGKMDISLNLPEKTDTFFNIETMNGRLGFPKNNPNPAEYNDAEYWFSEILKFIPLHKWITFFNYSAEESISFWQETKGSVQKKKYIYQGGVAEALARFKDTENVRIFLKNYDDHVSKIYYLLSQSDFEEAIIKHRNVAEGGTIELIKQYSKQGWSLKFSQHILQQLCNSSNHYHSQHFVPSIFQYLHSKAIENTPKIQAQDNQPWHQQQWEKHFVEPMLNMLSIRNQIENL